MITQQTKSERARFDLEYQSKPSNPNRDLLHSMESHQQPSAEKKQKQTKRTKKKRFEWMTAETPQRLKIGTKPQWV